VVVEIQPFFHIVAAKAKACRSSQGIYDALQEGSLSHHRISSTLHGGCIAQHEAAWMGHNASASSLDLRRNHTLKFPFLVHAMYLSFTGGH
jgi:hypothetical protein